MLAGQLNCVQCTNNDLHPNPAKLKGLFTPSLIRGWVEESVMTPSTAAKIVLRLLKKHGSEVLLSTDHQFLSGAKRCPRPSCDTWVDKPWQHGCHHFQCGICHIHFCFRCMNYCGDGSTFFQGIGGCPTPGCHMHCSLDNSECFCKPCDVCKPGTPCKDCHGCVVCDELEE